MNPLISIIIPTHNRGHLIRETIQSVLNQTYTNWECLIVDDGSNDNTETVVLEIKDPRIKYLYKDHAERSEARNLGLIKAKGEFIQFLDSDDILQKTKLEVSLEKIKQGEVSKSICITNFRSFSNASQETRDPYCQLKKDKLNFKSILFDWDKNFTIPIHCGLFESSLLKKFHFPVNLNQKEDWFLWLHVFLHHNLRTHFIDEPLVLYRFYEEVPDNTNNGVKEIEIGVLKYLKNVIPESSRADFYLKLIEDKNKRISQLQNSVINYRNTRTYKVSQLVKNLLKLNLNDR